MQTTKWSSKQKVVTSGKEENVVSIEGKVDCHHFAGPPRKLTKPRAFPELVPTLR